MSTNPFSKIVYRTNAAAEVNKPAKSRYYHSTKTSTSSSKKISSAKAWANASNIATAVLGTGMSIFQTAASLKQASKVISGQNPYDTKNSAGIAEVTTAQSATDEINKAIETYNKEGDYSGLQSCVARESECASQATSIENMVKDAETKVTKQNEDISAETKKNEGYKKAFDTAKEDEKTAEGDYNSADTEVQTATTNLTQATQGVVTAQAGVTTAEASVTTAQAQVDTASASAGTPAGAIALGVAQAQLVQAQATLTAKKLELTQAQTKKTQAELDKTNAETKKTKAKQAWDTKKANRAEAEKTLGESDKKVKSLKEGLQTAKTALDTAKKNQLVAKTANSNWVKAIEKAKQTLAQGGYSETPEDKTKAKNKNFQFDSSKLSLYQPKSNPGQKIFDKWKADADKWQAQVEMGNKRLGIFPTSLTQNNSSQSTIWDKYKSNN